MRIPPSKGSSISKTMYIQTSWKFSSSANITESLTSYLQAYLQSSHTQESLPTPTDFYATEIWASILCQFARPPFNFVHIWIKLRYRLPLYFSQIVMHQQNKEKIVRTNDAVDQIWLNSQTHLSIIDHTTFSSLASVRITPVDSTQYRHVQILPGKFMSQFLFATTISVCSILTRSMKI